VDNTVIRAQPVLAKSRRDDSAMLAQILRMGNPDLQYIAIPAIQLTATPEFIRIIYPALQNFGEVSQDTATLNFSVTLRPG